MVAATRLREGAFEYRLNGHALAKNEPLGLKIWRSVDTTSLR